MSESETCPVCNDEYVNKRVIERGRSITVRSDYTACREDDTEMRGSHGNWNKTDVTNVYIHK